jgi:hypothetical protein
MYRLPYVLISSGVLVDTKGDSNKAFISNLQSVINHKQIVPKGYDGSASDTPPKIQEQLLDVKKKFNSLLHN